MVLMAQKQTPSRKSCGTVDEAPAQLATRGRVRANKREDDADDDDDYDDRHLSPCTPMRATPSVYANVQSR